jgi:hypothetical protein
VTKAPGDRLLELVSPWVARGQLALANQIRRLLYQHAPDLFANLDFADDGTFLEPLLFARFAVREHARRELLLACLQYLPSARKPATIDADTDAEGRVFVPGLGYIVGLPSSSLVRLLRDRAAPLDYSVGGSSSDAAQLSEWCVAPPRLTLLPYPVEALARAVDDARGTLRGQEEATRLHRDSVLTACSALRECWPCLSDAIASVVRHVVLFDDITRNSFATPAAHGIAFLNVALGTGVAFFVEDLAHQCGHVLFTAALEGESPLLRVSPATPVRDVIGVDDHRTMDVLLHGMFTQALMVEALGGFLRRRGGTDAHEIEGRLAFALVRLGLDLRACAGLEIYSDAGARLIRELLNTYTAAAERYRGVCERADLSAQPYNFDYPLYAERNMPVGV